MALYTSIMNYHHYWEKELVSTSFEIWKQRVSVEAAMKQIIELNIRPVYILSKIKIGYVLSFNPDTL